MKAAVVEALADLRKGLVGHAIEVMEDGEGGAYVVVEGLSLGPHFSPGLSWIGFHLAWTYPDSDVYPHFIDAVVRYIGNGSAPVATPTGNLPAAFSAGAMMPGFQRGAIQISRRSNHRDANTDSALYKLLRIQEFCQTR